MGETQAVGLWEAWVEKPCTPSQEGSYCCCLPMDHAYPCRPVGSGPRAAGEGLVLHTSLRALGLTRSTASAGSKASKNRVLGVVERKFGLAGP